jgi:hypothetical protein
MSFHELEFVGWIEVVVIGFTENQQSSAIIIAKLK